MIELSEEVTIPEIFFQVSTKYAHFPLLIIPKNSARSYAKDGQELSYKDCAQQVKKLMGMYQNAGYGIGHRVGLLLENRPEYFLHKLAMNALGICCVPLNPDHRAVEMAYVVNHAQLDFVIVIDELASLLKQAISISQHRCPIVPLYSNEIFPQPRTPCKSTTPNSETIASILYTSGTTGQPKGCLLSHRYELAAGAWYINRQGLATFGEACERIYNPLPVFHVNAGILSFYGAMLKGNCQIQTDRFQPGRWIQELHDTKATVVHYLGVVVPMLLNQPQHALEKEHHVRFAIGAGVDPQRHQEFEKRFGYPLIEIWGMTEMVRLIFDADLPRKVGTRCFGRTQRGLDVRVVNDQDEEVSDGVPGEMLIRYSEEKPRKDFFSGYLKDQEATEYAWRGGWFHTGDIVIRDSDGFLHFVERRKNIIRRSGENIAAAEVEAVLQTHLGVLQAAVLSVQDELREEEVLACVVLKDYSSQNLRKGIDEPIVKDLFEHCNQHLAYFKVPGWLFFTDHIPTTGTQKIQKHQIFQSDLDPRQTPGMIDLRSWKKRAR